MAPSNSPASSLTPNSALNFRTNLNRNKTKRWVDAPKVDYGGGWGDDDEEEEEEEEEGFDEPPSQPSAPPPPLRVSSNPVPTLHRQNSFDRGDDLVSPLSAVSQPAGWGRVPDVDVTNLPPTPSELEQRERRANPTPHIPQNVPTIQIPTPRIGQSPAVTPIKNPTYSQPPGQNAQKDISASPARERVPPPLGFDSPQRPAGNARAPERAIEKPLPMPKDALPKAKDETPATAPRAQPAEMKEDPKKPNMPWNSANLDKPTPPLPPPEDTTLETISENSYSGQSSPDMKQESSKNGGGAPHYEDYESVGFYGSSQRAISPPAVSTPKPVPERLPSSPYFPQQQQSPPSRLPASFSPPPAATVGPLSPSSPARPGSSSSGRIIRPADIYRRHEEQRRASEESSRPSMESITRSSIDMQRPPTRERRPSEPNQPRRADSRFSGRPESQPGSRQEQKGTDVRPGSRGETRPRSSKGVSSNPYLPPVGGLPGLPGNPALPEPRFSTWGNDLINVYTASPTDSEKKHEISIAPDVMPSQYEKEAARKASTGSPSSTRQSSDSSQGLRSMVDSAFHRQDTLVPTPSSDTASRISPIFQRQGSSSHYDMTGRNTSTPTQQLVPAAVAQRSPSPDTPRALPKEDPTTGTVGEITPVSTESGSLAGRSPENDELDVFLGELERANTPALSSGAHTPVPHRQSQQLDIPSEQGLNKESMLNRESMGVFSLYDSYWEESNPVPPPIQPKSPRRPSATPDPARRNTQEFASPPQKPAPANQKSLPPTDVTPRTHEEPQTPASTVSEVADPELLEMLATSRQFLTGSGTHVASPRKGSAPLPDVKQAPEEVTPTGSSEKTNRVSLPLESEGMQAIPPTKPLGPESEGIEVITGPTKVPPREEKKDGDDASPVGDEYAKELVNQFSRPQTLMLKDTMPMPSGVMVMPPMPPMPQVPQSQQAPDVVNFEDDGGEREELERSQPTEPDLSKVVSLPKGEDVSPAATPSPPTDEPTPFPSQQQPPHPVLRDPKIIATLPTPAERVEAYNALRKHVAETPNDLSKWLAWQLEHNNGKELLETTIVPRKANATTLRKTRSKMVLGGPFHPSSGDHEGAEKAAEKLERVGRGMANLGERAGGKVGGWMRKVGKKGHSGKESSGGTGSSGGFYNRFQGPGSGNTPVSTISLASTVMTERRRSPAPSGDNSQPPLPQQTTSLQQRQATPSSQTHQSTASLSSASTPKQSSAEERSAKVGPPPSTLLFQTSNASMPSSQPQRSFPQSATEYPKRTDSLPTVTATPDNDTKSSLPVFPKRGDSLNSQLPSQESDNFARDVMAAMNKTEKDKVLGSAPAKATPSPPQLPPKDEPSVAIPGFKNGGFKNNPVSPRQQPISPAPSVPYGGNQQGSYRAATADFTNSSPDQNSLKRQQSSPTQQIRQFSPQHDLQQQMPPPARRNSQGLMKSFTSLASSKRSETAQSPPPTSSTAPTPGPHQDKSEDSGKKEKKRSSLLGRVKAGVDGMARSTSLSNPTFQDAPGKEPSQNPKTGKRPSLLSRLGTDPKRTSQGKGEDVNGAEAKEGKEKNHKKGFSMDLFARSASTSAVSSKLAKAGLAGGGSGGARILVGPKTPGQHANKNHGPYAPPPLAGSQRGPGQIQGQSQYGHPYGPGPGQGYSPSSPYAPNVPVSGSQPLPQIPHSPTQGQVMRSRRNSQTGGYDAASPGYGPMTQQPYTTAQQTQYGYKPDQSGDPSRQRTINENGSAPPQSSSYQQFLPPIHQQSPKQNFMQSYPSPNGSYSPGSPPIPGSGHIPYHGPEFQTSTLRVVHGPTEPNSVSPSAKINSSPSLPPIEGGGGFSLFSETIQPQPKQSSVTTPPDAGSSKLDGGKQSITSPSSPPTNGALPPAPVMLKSPKTETPPAPTETVNGNKGKGKAPVTPANAEEKIALFHEHEDHEGLQAVDGSRKKDESDDEDEGYKMSATAFPGQAWEPEFYGY